MRLNLWLNHITHESDRQHPWRSGHALPTQRGHTRDERQNMRTIGPARKQRTHRRSTGCRTRTRVR